MKSKFISLLSVVLITSCIDEYPFELSFGEPKLTVDALVSSVEGDSKVVIGWTYPAGETCSYLDYYTHKKIPQECPEDTSIDGPFLVTGKIQIQETNGNSYEYNFQMKDRTNYKTISMPSLIGQPGKSYSLNIDITYANKTTSYTSETTMHHTPAITKIDYEIRKGDVGKEDNFVPLIYFTEPQNQENYYLFNLCEINWNYASCNDGGGRVWPYSIISDVFLPEFVEGLSIDDGASVAKYAEFYPRGGAKIRMFSITKETYEYYKALLNQFNNDGGSYSPTPATPPSNISNGAIGIFRALHESSASIYY
jgi:hypothetical protein